MVNEFANSLLDDSRRGSPAQPTADRVAIRDRTTHAQTCTKCRRASESAG